MPRGLVDRVGLETVMPPVIGKESNEPTSHGWFFYFMDETKLIDRFGRRITYLRVSVTDRCNHRCAYCAPMNNILTREEILSFDEIARIVSLMCLMGVKKVRLTGGEPLVRKDIVNLAGMLKAMGSLEEITMTTNAVLLKKFARSLKENGIDRVNISLDTLKPERFRRITNGGELAPVLEGIYNAMEYGLTPIKLNTVILRGINDDELSDIIDFAAKNSLNVRFIECMPMSAGFDWKKYYIPVEEILKRPDIIERVKIPTVSSAALDAPSPLWGEGWGEGAKTAPSKPAQGAPAYILPLKSGGSVGFISPMSNRFCANCNRLRLTSDGRLRTCLPKELDIDIRSALRENRSDVELMELIKNAALSKPETGIYNFDEEKRTRSMLRIGG